MRIGRSFPSTPILLRPPPAGPPLQRMKWYNGAVYVAKPLKKNISGVWTEKPVRVNPTGSAWI